MRRVRRKGGNKEKVFGCDLLEHLTTSCQEIPMVLRCCSEFVEQNGIVDGIYRLSGVSSNIQKLRSEFEGEGSPDLNKDLYLQDIHCVSSLCKAYFRELPNPLLTYQLYDKFAEAVAIQLEEERLVKIRDVLKELPEPHYRTLEFLMRHLVRMASLSSETNMHARNLAIVWAPNLLRSKDIEASGFNGTAAFMEVRVQSIVVEFILTHVPQLFPEHDVKDQRRKSLPSPSAISNQDEMFFKAVPTPAAANFGNISPGDGPLPIRPYHAIIEGTDKRKGSLKGRKWMSIFNIGGRFQDQRRRHKHSAKEKERPPLRPARSMDSLSTPTYPNEGSRHPPKHPPSTHMSRLVTPVPQSGSDLTVSSIAIGGSEYAVTYRRGTGLVSGNAGTQGTYTALDPDGSNPNVTLQSRSPGVSSKAGRRAAMHITGPTLVTVPLHITSNLALGMLQGGGSDRVVHRGNNKEGVDRVEGKEESDKTVKKENRENKVDTDRQIQKDSLEDIQTVSDKKSDTEGEEKLDDKEGEEAEEVERDSQLVSEKRESAISNTEECPDEDVDEEVSDADDSDYMVMEGGEGDHNQSVLTQQADEGMYQASEILNSTEMDGYDHELSGYVQDNFEFLDQMDCCVLDHMDSSVSYQVNEFSVEPPGHSDDEYEIMEPDQALKPPANSHLQPRPESFSHTESKPRRPLSLDLHSRHSKSFSLPHMTSPIQGPEDSDSEEEIVRDTSEEDDDDSNSDEGESMFVKSLPSDVLLNTLSRLDLDSNKQDGCSSELQETLSQSPNLELDACKEQTTGFGDMTENKELKESSEEEDEVQPRNEIQSAETEEKPKSPNDAQSESSLTSMGEKNSEDFVPVSDMKVKGDAEEFEILPEESKPGSENPCDAQEETSDTPLGDSVDLSVPEDETAKDGDAKEDCRVFTELEDTCQEVVLERNGETCEENIENSGKTEEDEMQKESSVERNIWEVLEDIVCEVIEDEESKHSKREREEKDGGDESRKEAEVEVEKELNEVSEIQEEFVENIAKRSKESYNKEVRISKQPEREDNCRESKRGEQSEDTKGLQERGKCQTSKCVLEGVGRKLVISKNPKVYQVKAVPVVPPKPQHCKMTALTLRQQQDRERRDLEKGRENTTEVTGERDRVCMGQINMEESVERKEKLRLAERRRDGDRNSPLSMCFDEAVAIATMRREKERREGDGEMEGSGK